MRFLVFQLQAPLSSWGEPAVGEFRGTAEHPSRSALVGLLGAALGIRRDDEAGHAALSEGYGFAVGRQSGGALLRDFHTAQVPPRSALKGRPHATRRDELDMPKRELTTVLSMRDYRQDAASLVVVQPRDGAPYPLERLAQALQRPHFVLYLGRKSCPPGAPLWPQLIEAESAVEALARYASLHEAARSAKSALDERGRPPFEPMRPIERLAFDPDVAAGVDAQLSVRRKDRVIRRRGWQFGDRDELVAVMTAAEA